MTDAWGRPTHCRYCGKRLRPHPHAGRPRVICGSRACELRRRAYYRAAKRPSHCPECGASSAIPHSLKCAIGDTEHSRGANHG